MKKQITFYFSFCEIVEGENEEEIINKVENLCEIELTPNCWNYIDNTEIEELPEDEKTEKNKEVIKDKMYKIKFRWTEEHEYIVTAKNYEEAIKIFNEEKKEGFGGKDTYRDENNPCIIIDED